MVLMVKRNRGEHLIRRFAGRGNELDPRDVKIASLKQRIQELEFSQLQQDSSAEEAETESNETESEPIIWDIGDEEEEYPFVNKYLSFQEEPIVLVEEESCPVYDTDNEEEESMPVYDTDIEDVIEECLTMRMRDMTLQRRVGILRKEMKAMLTLSLCRVVRHPAKVVVLPNLGVSGG
ncbi:hypothetical protein Tco_0008884 [Tanacetum coccineum]